jgi:hypothetical protein
MVQEGPIMVVLALTALGVIGLVGGVLAAAISGTHSRLACFILAGVVLLATLANLLLRLGSEPDWYKVGTLLLTGPAIVLVGLRRSHPSAKT